MKYSATKLALYLLIFLGLVGWIGFIYTHGRSKKYEQDIAQLQSNMRASTDSLRTYRLKNGNLLAAKAGWILERAEMIKKLNISEKEVREAENKLNSSVREITKVETRVVVDTIYPTGDSTIYNYHDNWLALKAETNPLKIYDIEMRVPLVIGRTRDDQAYVTSPNPYVLFDSIESVRGPEKRKSRWGISAYGGVGVQYGLINKQIDLGPQVGIGITYKIF